MPRSVEEHDAEYWGRKPPPRKSKALVWIIGCAVVSMILWMLT